MEVIPAIDLRGGRCVRLFRGDFQAETVYGDHPVEVARRFEGQGARRLHVVDLDAAAGDGSNRDVVRRSPERGIPVQLGGIGRRRRSSRRSPTGGRVIGCSGLEPMSRTDHQRLDVVIAVDVRGRVDARLAREAPPEGRSPHSRRGAAVHLTSIARDGTMDGPDLRLYEHIVELTDAPIIASGGVRVADDVWSLRDLGLEACVVGKAMYSGTLRLREVVRG
jgi:phosphoribosylformimino-5-aminoimidazole carboxamide ribonucleotide (ProFAR) isomerase